jgi:hypothetical protein
MSERGARTALDAARGGDGPAAALDEADLVLAWRVCALERAGYDDVAVVALATDRHVDLHQAVRLLERGCPRETALRILL